MDILLRLSCALGLAVFAALAGPILVEDSWLRLIVGVVGLSAILIGLSRLRARDKARVEKEETSD